MVCVQPRHTTAFAFEVPASGRAGYDKVAWTYGGSVPDVACPLYYRGQLYILHGVRRVLTRLDPKTGVKIWEGGLGGTVKFYASPTAADGKIYCVNIDGEVVTVAAGDEFKILSRVAMGGASVSSSIAIADGSLFIRADDKLYRVRKR